MNLPLRKQRQTAGEGVPVFGFSPNIATCFPKSSSSVPAISTTPGNTGYHQSRHEHHSQFEAERIQKPTLTSPKKQSADENNKEGDEILPGELDCVHHGGHVGDEGYVLHRLEPDQHCVERRQVSDAPDVVPDVRAVRVLWNVGMAFWCILP